MSPAMPAFRNDLASDSATIPRMNGIDRAMPPGDDHAHSDDERSFDERSVAADSWSMKSEYGSTLDGDGARAEELASLLSTVEMKSPFGRDKEQDEEEVRDGSELGLRSHWDAVYTGELANFHEHGEPGEIWFGEDVMEMMTTWITKLAAVVAEGGDISSKDMSTTQANDSCTAGAAEAWRVLDLGTGNGLLLHALAKRGFRDLTGTDYSEPALELARALAEKEGLGHVNFVADDLLQSQLDGPYDLVMDKGTLDAVGLHPDGLAHRVLYRQTVEKLVAPGGLLVVTSCNLTKEELTAEYTGPKPTASMGIGGKAAARPLPGDGSADSATATAYESVELAKATITNGSHHDYELAADLGASYENSAIFEYVDHVRNYPSYRFGGIEGSRVCTVAFRRKPV